MDTGCESCHCSRGASEEEVKFIGFHVLCFQLADYLIMNRSHKNHAAQLRSVQSVAEEELNSACEAETACKLVLDSLQDALRELKALDTETARTAGNSAELQKQSKTLVDHQCGLSATFGGSCEVALLVRRC